MSARDPDSIEAAVAWLRAHFRPERAGALSVVYQLELSGDGGGSIAICVDGGRARIQGGAAEAADVRLVLPARDYFGVLAGRENADLLYMAGRLRIEGDLSLAMKLRALFRPVA